MPTAVENPPPSESEASRSAADVPQADASEEQQTLPHEALFQFVRRTIAWVKAWSPRRKKWSAIGLGLAALTGLVIATTLALAPAPLPGVSVALAALDAGKYHRARFIAVQLRDNGELPPQQQGGVMFVMGAVAAYQAQDQWEGARRNYQLLAVRYLEQSLEVGIPAGRRGQAHLLMGRMYGQLHRLDEAVTFLELALADLEKHDQQPDVETRSLLATAYMRKSSPQLDKALEFNTHLLAAKDLSQAQRHAIVLQRATIQLRQDQWVAARETLEDLPEAGNFASGRQAMLARILMAEGRQLQSDIQDDDSAIPAQKKFEEALAVLRIAETSAGDDPSRFEAMYLRGLCLRRLHDYAAALDQLRLTRQSGFSAAEDFASLLAEAGLLQDMGRAEQAARAYRRCLQMAGWPEHFGNPWVTVDELRDEILVGYRRFYDARRFRQAVEMAQMLEPYLPHLRTTELLADTYNQWAEHLLREAEAAPPLEAQRLRSSAREKFRLAGDAAARLASRHVTDRDYPQELWLSAEEYLQGQDYVRARAVLQAYLKHESPLRTRPEAYVGLGESMLALQHTGGAIAVLDRCLAFHPTHPASFTARLLLSRAYLEAGELDKAADALLGNLHSPALRPSSPQWRDSLFALGRLLHLRGDWPGAIDRLREAVTRYPQDPQAMEANYLLADSFLNRADQLDGPDDTVIDAARLVHFREQQNLYASALDHIQRTVSSLQHRQQHFELTPLETMLQRNALFSRAAILTRLQRYDESLAAYSAVINRYQTRPEVLDAYVQIAAAYRQLRQPGKAKSAIAQAKAVLQRLPDGVGFTATTNPTRGGWISYLDWLATL